MWGSVSWPWAQRLRTLKGLWTTAVFQEQSSLNMSYQKINDLMSWNDCRMGAAASLRFLRKLPALFLPPVLSVAGAMLPECRKLRTHCDGQGRQSPSHLYLAHMFSIRFLKLGMELFAVLLTGFKSASYLLCFERSYAFMIKLKKSRCFCPVSSDLDFYTASLECIYALRHRTEVLVSHSGRGHTNVDSR